MLTMYDFWNVETNTFMLINKIGKIHQQTRVNFQLRTNEIIIPENKIVRPKNILAAFSLVAL